MISVEDARRAILLHTQMLEAVEKPLAEAGGRVLAEGVFADGCYPSGDRSMMDGYAIGLDESPGTFRVIGEIAAGGVPGQSLGRGEAMRVFTGALLPEGVGRVVMQEDVIRDGEVISIPTFGENRFIRVKGSEAIPGDLLLAKGTVLGGAEAAILAQVGRVLPRVVRCPVIRHVATGDELVAPGEIPLSGQIRDTNSSLLAGLLQGMGEVESYRTGDDPKGMMKFVEGQWDLLLISGGASVGDYDFGARTLRDLGFTIHFDRVNLRPGKPLTFATRGRQSAFVIPGNPVSHFVCFHVAIRLAIECMCGLPCRWDFLQLELTGDVVVKADPRETFWPARVVVADGKLKVQPKSWSTSGNGFSLAGANALIRVNGTSPRNGLASTLLLDLPGQA